MHSMFGAVWDLDGTLVDTGDNHFVAWRDLLKEYGRDLTREEFRSTFGLRNDDILTQHFGFDPAQYPITSMADRKEELYRASLERDGIHLQPGAVELVGLFRSLGVRQAIASSAPPANIETSLQLSGLASYFDVVVSSEEVARGKPAPDLILRAAERLRLPASRTVVLEDAPAGVQAGKAAGARVIAIDRTFPRDSLYEADLIVHSFEEVLWTADKWAAFIAS